MNILVVSFCSSHVIGNNAGNINYIYNINKHFQKLGHKIYFLYINSNGEPFNLQAMKEEWEEVFIVKDDKLWSKDTNRNKFDFANTEIVGKFAKNICISRNIDICICHYFVYSKILEMIPSNVIKVIDTHDIFTKRIKYLLKNLMPKEFLNIPTEKEEAVYLNRADIIIAKTKNDADFFNKITNSDKSIVIPHISFKENLVIDKRYRDLKSIGFVGSRNILNTFSILKFLNTFEDEYAKGTLADIQIKIAGNVFYNKKYICRGFYFKNRLKLFLSYISVKTFLNLFKPNIAKKFFFSEKSYVTKLGFVEDLDVFYKDVDLIIVPMIAGTGINIKTAEAIGRGIPIISTSNGIKGFNSNEKYHNINDMKDMIQVIKKIKQNPIILQNLAEKSKKIYLDYLKTFNEGVNRLFSKK